MFSFVEVKHLLGSSSYSRTTLPLPLVFPDVVLAAELASTWFTCMTLDRFAGLRFVFSTVFLMVDERSLLGEIF